MLGVHPKSNHRSIIKKTKRCGLVQWKIASGSLHFHLHGFIEGRKFSTATRSTLGKASDGFNGLRIIHGESRFKVLMDSLWNKEIAGCYTRDGFIQVLQVGRTQLCRIGC
ncbi:hypothetical protein Bca52824_059130 [Brassica carinata]|uniref:Uncharacterized protein n=1 Tax=Brassica carinata TaxID=52824 RepID=A0A8X7QTT6_BRACI|nr:hypothetical protein Bca52824_059130 [Brassica carinata]